MTPLNAKSIEKPCPKCIARLVELVPGALLVCLAWMQVEQRDRTSERRLNSGTPYIHL